MGIDLVWYLPRLLSNIQGLFYNQAGDFSTILNLIIPSRAHIIPTGTKASPYIIYSIASSTHTSPLPPAPILVVAHHVASGLLPKCKGGRLGSLLARNTRVATAPGIRLLPLRLDASKYADIARRISSRAPAAPAIVAYLLEPREQTFAEQIWLPRVGCAWCLGLLQTRRPRQSNSRLD